jgi:hypothetical protein
MAIRISISLVCATLLASAIPNSANAGPQFVVCTPDFIGCAANYTIGCNELRVDTIGAVKQKAAQICKDRGFSTGTFETVVNGPGGECGYYKFVVTCN